MTPAPWHFGGAASDITPSEPILLAGYMRDKPANSSRNSIHCKAAWLGAEDGTSAVFVNADIIGFSRALVDRVKNEVSERHAIPRENILLSATHNHSGPSIKGVLPLFYDLDTVQEQRIADYADFLVERITGCVSRAATAAEPCAIRFCSTLAGFGVNRRRVIPDRRHLPTVIDQDVPILSAWNQAGALRGLLFGYACHATVMFDNLIDGDYSSYAQTILEQEHPGCTAIFLAGCGGDVNPLPRRCQELAASYGYILSMAVIDALASPQIELAEATLVGNYSEVDLPLEPAPSLDELRLRRREETLLGNVRAEHFTPAPTDFSEEELASLFYRSVAAERRKLEHQIALHERGIVPKSIPYPIQILDLGGKVKLIGLAGEPVCEYALRLKEQHGFMRAWPLGYCNELLGYIPSDRVLREGGYEGRTSMAEYGWCSPFSPGIENAILSNVAATIEDLNRSRSVSRKETAAG